jgi:hypothetical protein
MNSILDQWEDCLTAGLSPEELEIAQRVLERMKTRAAAWLEEH